MPEICLGFVLAPKPLISAVRAVMARFCLRPSTSISGLNAAKARVSPGHDELQFVVR